jgi:succinate dehydrogenase / fumarate reductase cytochrome b subunit
MQTMERPDVAPVHRPPRGVRARAPWPVEFYRSAIGKKWVMAITGILLMGFVFAHMVGNLKVFMGADDFNHYGEWLRTVFTPPLPRTWFLWILRLGLVAAFALHIHAAASLTLMNRRARSGAALVQPRDWAAANAASRSMRLTGVVVLLFLVFHLVDLSWGTANPDFVRGDVYRNTVATFERPVVSAVYIVAVLALGLHLWHGSWSLFQSLGVNNPRWNAWRKWFAMGFAAVVTVGYLTTPIGVLTGIVNADDNSDCRVRGDTIETCELYEDGTADEAREPDRTVGRGPSGPLAPSARAEGVAR